MPYSDQIAAGLIQAAGETLLSQIHKLITSIWSKEELPNQWTEFTRVIKLTINHCYYHHTKLYQTFFFKG
jgi:hypothetical protein